MGKNQLCKQITCSNASTVDLHCAQSSHLSTGGPRGSRGRGRTAEQHASVRDYPADLHGHSGVCWRQVCQQAGPGIPGLRHSLHPGCLRWRHQDCSRPSHIPVSTYYQGCHKV